MKRTKSKSRNKKTFREEFPGYPHYPVKEDIMNSPDEKLSIDLEKPENPLVKEPVREITPETMLPEKGSEEDFPLVKGNSADVTKQEKQELGDPNLSMDLRDDDDVFRDRPEEERDMAGEDLVVPGAELDDDSERIGSEDEENNLYSLGGDEKN